MVGDTPLCSLSLSAPFNFFFFFPSSVLHLEIYPVLAWVCWFVQLFCCFSRPWVLLPVSIFVLVKGYGWCRVVYCDLRFAIFCCIREDDPVGGDYKKFLFVWSWCNSFVFFQEQTLRLVMARGLLSRRQIGPSLTIAAWTGLVCLPCLPPKA